MPWCGIIASGKQAKFALQVLIFYHGRLLAITAFEALLHHRKLTEGL
jgi:hypothetical protein